MYTRFPYTAHVRSAAPAVIATIRRSVEAHPEISAINHVRTIHTAPDSIFVAVSADFEDELLMGQAEALIETIEGEFKAASPLFSSIYIRPEKRENAVVPYPGAMPDSWNSEHRVLNLTHGPVRLQRSQDN